MLSKRVDGGACDKQFPLEYVNMDRHKRIQILIDVVAS